MVISDKQKVTLNLSTEVVRAYRLAAVRQGSQDQAIVEQALREFLGLNSLKRLQESFVHLELTQDQADQLAVEAVRETRRERGNLARQKK